MLRPWQLEIRLDKKSGKAVYLQIADAIISDIRSGRLLSGSALPGSRNLAQMLGINRNTVVEALNVLLNEEWIVSKERRGNFVAAMPPALSKQRKDTPVKEPVSLPAKACSIQFDDGYPDSSIAPVTELARAYRQLFSRNARWHMMGYRNELGDIAFRQAIAQMLNHQRGMHANEHSTCITRGSQMAMYLTAQCLFTKGDYVIIENPGYKPAWEAFKLSGVKLLPVRVDEGGLVIGDVEKHLRSGKRIKAIYTTPHHQYPTTVTLSLQRRLALVRLSNQYNFTIIEDDYDNEFHFGYRPVLPLCSFPDLRNYVYIGTLSKVVAPALRIGYLVAGDHDLVRRIGELRRLIDVQGDGIMEQAVLQLIKDGTIKKHIRKATQHYKAKRDLTVSLLKNYLQDKVDYSVPDGGLAFWIIPKKPMNRLDIANKLSGQGIKLPLPEYYSNGRPVNGIRIGFGALSEQQLEEGIAALAKYL